MIRYQINNQAVFMTLDRARYKNALNAELLKNLLIFLARARRDKTIKVLCLQGQGSFFCAGADINEMARRGERLLTLLSETLAQLYAFPKPVIALVEGGAYGGGLGLLACADIVLATPQSRFCFSEITRGLAPAVISPYVIKKMGESFSKYYFLGAGILSAKQAQAAGLIHDVKHPAQLAAHADKLIRQFCFYDLASLKIIKQLFLPVSLQRQKQLIKKSLTLLNKKETQKCLKAFLKK